MMLKNLEAFTGALRFKIHGFALGMTLALAALLLAPACVATGG